MCSVGSPLEDAPVYMSRVNAAIEGKERQVDKEWSKKDEIKKQQLRGGLMGDEIQICSTQIGGQ